MVAQADCCALCIDIVVLLRHQLAESSETLAGRNALGPRTAAHCVYTPCRPCEEVAKRTASPSKPHGRGLFVCHFDCIRGPDDGELLILRQEPGPNIQRVHN